jgi:hypothetical protein
MTTTSGFQLLGSRLLFLDPYSADSPHFLGDIHRGNLPEHPADLNCTGERVVPTSPDLACYPSPPKLKWDGKSNAGTWLASAGLRDALKKYIRVDVKDFLINMFYPRLPGEGLSILSEVHPARLLLLLVPQLRVPDRSGHRRTSTTSSRCQSALSGLNASSGSLPHCRTPTARARSLTVGTRDLNCECEMSDRMSEEMSDRMPDRMSERMTE